MVFLGTYAVAIVTVTVRLSASLRSNMMVIHYKSRKQNPDLGFNRDRVCVPRKGFEATRKESKLEACEYRCTITGLLSRYYEPFISHHSEYDKACLIITAYLWSQKPSVCLLPVIIALRSISARATAGSSYLIACV